MASGSKWFEGWRCHFVCSINVYSSVLDGDILSWFLAQNRCRGFVAVDVVNYYTSEFDRGDWNSWSIWKCIFLNSVYFWCYNDLCVSLWRYIERWCYFRVHSCAHCLETMKIIHSKVASEIKIGRISDTLIELVSSGTNLIKDVHCMFWFCFFLNSPPTLTHEMGRCLRVINVSSACKKHRITPKFIKLMLQSLCVVLSCPIPPPWIGCFLYKLRCHCLVHLLMPPCCIVSVQACKTYVIIWSENIKRKVFHYLSLLGKCKNT